MLLSAMGNNARKSVATAFWGVWARGGVHLLAMECSTSAHCFYTTCFYNTLSAIQHSNSQHKIYQSIGHF